MRTTKVQISLRSHAVWSAPSVMILSFWTDSPGQTVQTQIRVYTVCHSVCIVWTHYSIVEPHSSNFRVITTNILGVQIFRKFTVCCLLLRWYYTSSFCNQNLKTLACLISWVGRFESYVVANPKDRFSCDDARSSTLLTRALMHQSFVTPAPHLQGWAGDCGADVQDNDLLSSPSTG